MADDDWPFPYDPVIEFYKKDIDRSLLRENLRRTIEERIRNMQNMSAAIEELRRAGREARARQ